MIPEFGLYAIILSSVIALFQAAIPWFGQRYRSTAMVQRFTVAQCFCIFIAFSSLSYCFLVNDFSVAYVANNSNTSLPWFYRLCAVWGAHEGSLLLWVFILTIWMVAVSFFSRELPIDMRIRVLSVLALLALGFYFFLLTTSNPFLRYLQNIPINGRDLNPLLQDPGLMVHPPLLYLGYVGLSVPFAFAVAALWRGEFHGSWARWTRPWTLLAWCFLSLGIILGSWWAYRVLGWGGFWFWDPVENASFLPWLAATALLHILVVVQKRDAFKAWAILLAICAFSLSLLGTFLVRSGILISVHAFANDPKRGLYLLEFLVLVVGISLGLYAWRAHKINSSGRFSFLSREMAIMSNNFLFFIAMLTVLIGTIYPLIIDVFGFTKLSVGAPYFNTVFFPLMWPLLFLMGVVGHLKWRSTKLVQLKVLCLKFFILLALSFVLTFFLMTPWKPMLSVGCFMVLWIIFNLPRREYAMFFAHLGVAITVLGLLFVSMYTQTRDLRIRPGESLKMANYTFQLVRVVRQEGPNYSAARATVALRKNSHEIAVLHPEQRIYSVEKSVISKVDIDASIFRDLYVALGSPLSNGAWELRVYYKPMVRWIWFGGFLMILGAVLALFKLKRQ